MLTISSFVIFIMPSSVNLRTTMCEPVTKKYIPQLGAKIYKLFLYKWSLQWIFFIKMILAMNYPHTNDPCNELSSYKWSLQWIILVQMILAMNCPRKNGPCDELSSYKSSSRWIVLVQMILAMNCPHTNHLRYELSSYKWYLQWTVFVQMILSMNCLHKNYPCNELSSYKWSLQWIVLIRIIFAMNCPCTNDPCNNRQFKVQNFHRASDKLNVLLSINPRDLVCISCPEKHAFVLPDSAGTAEHPGGGWWISRSASGIRKKSGSSSARR